METLLWHYAYGKPREVVEVSAELSIAKIVRLILPSSTVPGSLAPPPDDRDATRVADREVTKLIGDGEGQ